MLSPFRGMSNGSSNDVPFRAWYSKIPELKALLRNPCLAIFTATASKSTKRRIFEILGVSLLNTHVIQHEPIKNNLRFAVQYVERDQSLDKILAFLVSELKSKGIKTCGALIFCRTRKQWSAIYKLLQIDLGNKIYRGQSDSPMERIIEMYHAGTPATVQHHILSTLTKENGHIRVLVCTVAFGMGIDCQYITRVVHFGGSKNIESYIQECGRAGRKGEISMCILLYNGILLQHSDDDIKNYAASKTCRRVEMRHSFPESKTSDKVLGCNCCDKCATDCNLPHDDCCKGILRQIQVNTDVLEQPTKIRPVSLQSKIELREMLESYRVSLLPEPQSAQFVSYANMLFEFDSLQISQAVNSCYKIFSIEDVKKFVEIWRNRYAVNILAAIHQIFNDFQLDIEVEDLAEDDQSTLEDSLHWDESVLSSINTTHLENLECTEQDIEMSSDNEFQDEIELIADEASKKFIYNDE